MCEVRINPTFVRFCHLRWEWCAWTSFHGLPNRLCSGVETLELSFKEGDIALAEPPLPTFLECRYNTATRQLVNRIRTQVQKKCYFPGIQQQVLFVCHQSWAHGTMSEYQHQTRLFSMETIGKSSHSPLGAGTCPAFTDSSTTPISPPRQSVLFSIRAPIPRLNRSVGPVQTLMRTSFLVDNR